MTEQSGGGPREPGPPGIRRSYVRGPSVTGAPPDEGEGGSPGNIVFPSESLPPEFVERLENARTATEVVAERLRELRTRQNLSAQKLADRCKELGAPKLDRAVISNLENKRRENVTLEEVLVLAYALNVSPIHLMINPEPDSFMRIGKWKTETPYVREWVRGHYALAMQDVGIFTTAGPQEEWPERLKQLLEAQKAEGEARQTKAEGEARQTREAE